MKAGKYTAAILLLTVGSILLVDLAAGTSWTAALLDWWPVVLIALGVEYMIVSVLNRNAGGKIGISFGSLILAAGISVAAIAVTHAGNLPHLNWTINFGSVSFADETGHRHEMDPVRIPVDDRTETIFLRNHAGNVTIRTGDVREIEVKGTVFVQKSVDHHEKIAKETGIRFDQRGDRLEIVVDGKEYRVFGMKQRPRVNLSITVPHDLDQNWRIDLTNGRVDAEGLTVREQLVADTTNGSVDLRNIAGNVRGDTTNGRVTLRQIRGDAIADTTNGRVTVEDVSGNVTVDTTNGQVDVKDVGGNVRVDTTHGNVTLQRIAGDVKADTTNGSVRLTEAGGTVTASTTNGEITVRTSTMAGDYRFDSANGKVNLHLPEDASFEVDGETAWGSIHSDFGLRIDRKTVTGSVNGGQYKIVIDTNSPIGIYAN